MNTSAELTLLLAVIATWRMSVMMVYESGPYSIFETARYIMAKAPSWISGLTIFVTCLWCCSIWVAALLVLLLGFQVGLADFVAKTIAVSGGAMVLHVVLDRVRVPGKTPWG